MIEIIIVGVLGRMGRMILLSAEKNSNLVVVGGVVKSPKDLQSSVFFRGSSLSLSCDIKDFLKSEVIVIDFTSVATTLSILPLIQEKKAKVVIGTTGFNTEEKKEIEQFSTCIPIVFSSNMSIGVNVLFSVVTKVASTLGVDYDVEIIEAHHNKKKDSPSGTAIGLLDAVTTGHNSSSDDVVCHGRKGFYKNRSKGEVGMHAVRAGDIVGDHTVLFAGIAERLELKHVAHDRSVFAYGSCTAAHFLKNKNKGLFTMLDVLNLK